MQDLPKDAGESRTLTEFTEGGRGVNQYKSLYYDAWRRMNYRRFDGGRVDPGRL
jgi:hypothetical protein